MRAGGFHLVNSARERIWRTETGKANFKATPLPRETAREAAIRSLGIPVFTLTTFRAHDQYNTTVYARNDRYRGIQGTRSVVFMHPEDIADMNLAAGQRVTLSTVADDDRPRMLSGLLPMAYDIPRGCLGAYFPEANVLVPLKSHGKRSGTPSSKAILVTVSPDSRP
jgi:anaerobic selenocysteine-containing dehydrogenase